jgi:glycosyltransferase involved in cell wall biosynthesis
MAQAWQKQPRKVNPTMTTISVVIPALDDEDLLARCLDALAAQTRQADEIIVVDNGSIDSTSEVARRAGALVILEPLRGIFPATAAGFDAATGDVVARLDADSRPASDWLHRVELALAATNGLTAVTGPGEFYGANAAIRWIGRELYIGGMFWSLNILLGHPPLFGSNYAMPAAMWQRVRGSVNRTVREIHDDLDLSYHLTPEMNVIYDETLRVEVSSRPFDSFSALGRRLAWVYTTLSLDFAEESPFVRRRKRRQWAAQHADEAPTGLIA